MNIRDYNRDAWDKQVDKGNVWTQPVSPGIIANARRGEWSVLLTEQKGVPREWFNNASSLTPFGTGSLTYDDSRSESHSIQGYDILCLASGGGQQAPIFAAVGAHVTVLDNSPRQLAQDRFVAERESLTLTTIEGDARGQAMT